MKFNETFNYIFKTLWVVMAFLIVFFDRSNNILVSITILLLIFLTIITVARSINSRNEWRKIIEDGDVEIKDKIKF